MCGGRARSDAKPSGLFPRLAPSLLSRGLRCALSPPSPEELPARASRAPPLGFHAALVLVAGRDTDSTFTRNRTTPHWLNSLDPTDPGDVVRRVCAVRDVGRIEFGRRVGAVGNLWRAVLDTHAPSPPIGGRGQGEGVAQVFAVWSARLQARCFAERKRHAGLKARGPTCQRPGEALTPGFRHPDKRPDDRTSCARRACTWR